MDKENTTIRSFQELLEDFYTDFEIYAQIKSRDPLDVREKALLKFFARWLDTKMIKIKFQKGEKSDVQN
jgi:hypothetical protein